MESITHHMNVRLTSDLKAWAVAQAAEEGCSISSLVIRALHREREWMEGLKRLEANEAAVRQVLEAARIFVKKKKGKITQEFGGWPHKVRLFLKPEGEREFWLATIQDGRIVKRTRRFDEACK